MRNISSYKVYNQQITEIPNALQFADSQYDIGI